MGVVRHNISKGQSDRLPVSEPEYRFAEQDSVSEEFVQRFLASWMDHLVSLAATEARRPDPPK
jgi:hypothetical protein